MKLYTFTKKDSDETITQVRANNHDQAIAMAGNGIDYSTDFYSSNIDEMEAIEPAHMIVTGLFIEPHKCVRCGFESYSSTAMLNHANNVVWNDHDSLDRESDVEERDECNTCGRTEYMCAGH